MPLVGRGSRRARNTNSEGHLHCHLWSHWWPTRDGCVTDTGPPGRVLACGHMSVQLPPQAPSQSTEAPQWRGAPTSLPSWPAPSSASASQWALPQESVCPAVISYQSLSPPCTPGHATENLLYPTFQWLWKRTWSVRG